MEFKEISDLIKQISKSNLIEFKLKDGEFELFIQTDKHGKSSPRPAPVSVVSAPLAPAQPAMPAVAPVAAPLAPAPAAEDSSAKPADEGSAQTGLLEIRSPMVGTFYRSSGPDKGPFVKVGDTIEAGSVVCIVEAMKLFNEIESEISGKIAKVVVEDAAPVEYDQVLFLVEP
ncbi:MAG: acetyl-CoA carboxylase biotin carboxyl carrier protein [Saprospiraceae bacterium]|nr:acetyl-CoA carboxylase biotin carboxyl carrier protein [Saprospiraceae bacterium]